VCVRYHRNALLYKAEGVIIEIAVVSSNVTPSARTRLYFCVAGGSMMVELVGESCTNRAGKSWTYS